MWNIFSTASIAQTYTYINKYIERSEWMDPNFIFRVRLGQAKHSTAWPSLAVSLASPVLARARH